MPGRPRPVERETVEGLWATVVLVPLLLSCLVVATFLGKSAGPPWQNWAVRGAVALVALVFARAAVGDRVRELRRRGRWVPPGASRPWLLAAALILAFGSAVAGLVFGVGSVVRQFGGAGPAPGP